MPLPAILGPRKIALPRKLCAVALLVALGWTLHLFMAPLPRWQLPGRFSLQGFAADGREVVVCGRIEDAEESAVVRRSFRWLDAATGQVLRTIDVTCSYHEFAPDATLLAAGDADTLWLIDGASGRRVAVPGVGKGVHWPSVSLLFASSGRYLVHRDDQRLALIDTRTGEVAKRWDANLHRVSFIRDTHTLVVMEHERGARITVWDADAARLAAVFGPYEGDVALTPGARFAFARRPDGASFDVIDLLAPKVVLTVVGTKPGRRAVAASDDDRVVAWQEHEAQITPPTVPQPPARIVFWDNNAQKRLSEAKTPPQANHPILSSDGKHCFVVHEPSESSGIELNKPRIMLDTRAGAQLWRGEDGFNSGDTVFSADGAIIGMYSSGGCDFTFFDTATGTPRSSIVLIPRGRWLSATWETSDVPTVTHDGSHAMFVHAGVKRTLKPPLFSRAIDLGKADQITIVDLIEGRAAARLRLDRIESRHFTSHGPTLLTTHQEDGAWFLAAWDVPLARPWPTIIGIPLAVGLGLTAIGRWRSRPSPARRAEPTLKNP